MIFMRNSFKTRTTDAKRKGIPPERTRIEILLALLKLKHFHALWYNGLTLGIRRCHTGPPEYLSWSDAQKILERASLETQTERRLAGAQGG